MKWRSVCALGLFLLSVSYLASADTSGTIRGTVVDPTGAVLQNAHVSVVNEGTNESRSVQTDANGNFQFVLLPVGTYTLRAEHAGFQSYVVKDIPLAVNQVATFPVTLKIGSTGDVVGVEATAAQVDTASTQLGTVIGSKPIVDLPLNGRNVYQLIALQPGITVTNGANGAPNDCCIGGSNSPNPIEFSSGGGRITANNFMVDGADVNNVEFNLAGVQPIPDAVEEFRVITNTFNAEFGRNSGSIVNVITKSGSNQWHGDLFEFLRNDKLNASNFFEAQTGTKATYKLNQFGGTLGGPIVKDKTFVFGSIQLSRERRGAPGIQNLVYTNDQRNGNFSADEPQFTGVLANTLCLPMDSPGNCTQFNAGTSWSTIFPGAQIPTSFFDPVSVNLLNKVIPIQNDGAGVFVNSPVQPHDIYQWTIKMDQQLTVNQKLSGFYYFEDASQTTQSAFPGFPTEFKARSQNLSLKDVWVVTPKTLNEFQIGFLRQAGFNGPGEGAFPSSFGFTGITPSAPASANSLPQIFIGGSIGLGSTGGVYSDYQNTYQVQDNFSKLSGNHTFKFGGDYRFIQNVEGLPTFPDGFITFGSGPNTNGVTNSTGDALADFVLGLPVTYQQGDTAHQRLHSHQVNFYGQDSWRIRPNLTLNYGLRWELNTPWVDKGNELNFIQPPLPGQAPAQSTIFPTAPPGYLFAGDPGIARGVARPEYTDFEPRIGLAFSPSWFGPGKLVLRSAYGIFYNPIEQFVLHQLNGEPPFAGTSFISDPGFANPFIDQAGNPHTNPFPFVPPAPGTPVNFSQYFPIDQFGELLPNQRSQYVEQYNLSLEYQLSRSMVFGAAYVGSEGHRLLASYDPDHGNPALCLQLANATVLGQPQACGPGGEDNVFLQNGQTFYGTRLFSAFANNGLPASNSAATEDYHDAVAINSIAQSSYNSAQFRLERRGQELEFLASYTYSKAMDNASGFENLLNPYCYKCDIGLSSFDAHHHFILSGTYDLPLKRFAPSAGLRQKLIDGWEIGGIYTYQSGNPVFIWDSSDDQSLQGSFDGFNPPDRPDLVGPIQKFNPHKTLLVNCTPVSGCQNENPFFNPNSFVLQPEGQIGDARHNFFAGPPINNLDFTVIKRTSFGERYSLEFRTEIFNLLNHAQFFNPVGDFSSSQFGDITTARDPRFIQFSMKLDF